VLFGEEHELALVKERAVRGERNLEFERVNSTACATARSSSSGRTTLTPTRWTSSKLN
jgi:hypothetical protein